MSSNGNYRICRYDFCKHPDKRIDIDNEEYVLKSRLYYHKDCFERKRKNDDKDENQRADLRLIKNLWTQHIDRNVEFPRLMSEMNKLLANGYQSDYLVFTLQYIIKHSMNLHYPGGFKYFIEKEEIKNAYVRKKLLKEKANVQSIEIINKNDSPMSAARPKQKPKGFASILKGR